MRGAQLVVALCALLLFGGGAVAWAEIAVMASGKLMQIERYQRRDERLTLFLEGGGAVTVDARDPSGSTRSTQRGGRPGIWMLLEAGVI